MHNWLHTIFPVWEIIYPGIAIEGKWTACSRICCNYAASRQKIFDCLFRFSGEVTVKIKSKLPLDKLVILPNKYGIKPEVDNNEAVLFLMVLAIYLLSLPDVIALY